MSPTSPHNPRPRRALIAALALGPLAVVSLGSCAVYNEECARFVADPDGVTGYLGGVVDIQRSSVRLKDNAIGQMVAESFYNSPYEGTDERPDLAIVNGGSIRSDGVCEVRDSLPPGGVQRKVLRDILPYDNDVKMVTISYKVLKQVFEHSIIEYEPLDPPGGYLQIAGARVTLDCSQPAQSLDANGHVTQEGKRVVSIELRQRDCQAADEESCYTKLNLEAEGTVNIALDSYILGGGDSFSMFQAARKDAELANKEWSEFKAPFINLETVASYFAEAYPEEAPLSSEPETRVILQNCGD